MSLEETIFAPDTPLWSRWRLGHTTLWHMNTLFGMGFKRKTSETSGEELAAAASAREKQEAADVTKLKAMAAEMRCRTPSTRLTRRTRRLVIWASHLLRWRMRRSGLAGWIGRKLRPKRVAHRAVVCRVP